VLFWIWVVVSLVLLVMRRLGTRRTELAAGSPVTGGPPADPAATEPRDPAAKVWPAPPPPDPGDDTFRLAPDHAAPSSAHPEPAPEHREVLPPPRDFSAEQPTLPDLLEGIRLPHDLVPLTQFAGEVADLSRHAVLSTTGASADEVRAGMQAELERLGYSVEHLTMMHLAAAGDRGTLLVDIHPDGAGVSEAGIARFPTAPGGSVVVELRVG
jgi:hypothetical protein